MENMPTIIPGVGYSRHTRPFPQTRNKVSLRYYLIRLQIKGHCHVSINGKTNVVQSGDLIMCKPGDEYELKIDRGISTADDTEQIDSSDYFLFCNGSWIKQWWEAHSLPAKVNITMDKGILSIWRRIIYEKRNLNENNAELLDYLLRVLLISLERLIRTSNDRSTPNHSYIPYQIKQYIEKNAVEPISLEGIAQYLGISVSTASHLFKQTFHQSIMRYVIEVRLSIASERILISGMKLEEVAASSGFHSYPYFCRTFRTQFGTSPREYRTLNQLL
ncbi:HTH-type transcriptional activator Btr [compost metagenome]